MDLVSFRFSGVLAHREARKASIRALEAQILKHPQTDCPTEHVYAPGVAARVMRIPPWTVLTGAEHTTDHLALVTFGRIEVETDEGMRVLKAGDMFVSRAGAKRAGRTFKEGAIFVTIHANPDDCQNESVLVERWSTSKIGDLLQTRIALEKVKETPCL